MLDLRLQGLGISQDKIELWRRARAETKEVRRRIRATADVNFTKVMRAFKEVGLAEVELAGSTGYGYSDDARVGLDRLLAAMFGCEEAAIRLQWVSGTHAITSALRGCLRPGKTLLAATGAPYDTLAPVIGHPVSYPGSLSEWGVNYREVPLQEGGIDIDSVLQAIDDDTGVVFFQRSRGYSWRKSLSVDELGRAIQAVRARVQDQAVVLVDNCYGEMVELQEPSELGADIIAGSLIKNLGATIVPTGAYLAGSAKAIQASLTAFTAPGLGGHVGPTLGLARGIAQALSLAPQTIAQSLEGLVVAAWLFEEAGFKTSPSWSEPRTDTIQAVCLGSIESQRIFCRAVQSVGLVDSGATPIAVVQPGYRDPILMAGGTFISGSSAELSADGPEREPYVCYLQGGTARVHVEIAALRALAELCKDKGVSYCVNSGKASS